MGGLELLHLLMARSCRNEARRPGAAARKRRAVLHYAIKWASEDALATSNPKQNATASAEAHNF